MEDQNSNHWRTILLVDGEDGTRIMAKWFLSNFDFAVETARSGEEALARFNPQIHDLVITENLMAGMSGVELAHIIKLRSPTTPVIMLASVPPQDRTCLDLVFLRPFHLMLLKEGLDRILASPSLPTQLTGQPLQP